MFVTTKRYFMKKFDYKNIFYYIKRFADKTDEKQKLIVLAFFIGVAAAIIVFLFETAVEGIKDFVFNLYSQPSLRYLIFVTPVVGIIIVTLFVKYVVKDDISHGVTRVLKAISSKSSKIKGHNTYSSMIAGALTIGFGGSVGPEAPTVLTGSAIGSNFGKAFGLNHRQTTILLGCGAAAALAAIFKAPITGVVFVLEVLLIEMAISSMIPLLIAAVTATMLIYVIHDPVPVFNTVLPDSPVSVKDMPFYIILGLICGFVSYYIIYSSGKIEGWFKKIKKQYVKWIIGGSAIGLLVVLLPPLYGQGYDSITTLLSGNIDSLFSNSLFADMKDNSWVVIAFLAAIIIFKSIAMACTNAAGGVGGVFAPSIFLGAFTGFFTAYAINTIFGLELPVVCFVLVGMAGVMSGAMDSPLTAIFLIAEITGGYKLFVPLMLVAAISFAISYYYAPYSVYTREFVLKGDTITLSKERALLFLDINNLIECDFTTVHQDMTLRDMVDVVAESKRNLYPVVNEARNLVGYLTLDDIRKDIFRSESLDELKVSDYMATPPDIILDDDNIGTILDKFDKSGSWNLPVITNKDKKYLGFISKSKIFSEYRNELQN